MQSRTYITLLCCFAGFFIAKAQENNTTIKAEKTEKLNIQAYDALKPAKAAFYSAVLPGLGQIKNKDWWKAPVVWAALGTGVYFVVDNHNEAERFRSAFKDRLAGREDEFTAEGITISDDGLIDGQEFYRKQKETAILVTAGMYILQIVEANVDAHLSQFDVEDRLTINTSIDLDQMLQPVYGIRLTYQLD